MVRIINKKQVRKHERSKKDEQISALFEIEQLLNALNIHMERCDVLFQQVIASIADVKKQING